ncbi:MAG: hypothetical protein J5739_08170 [Lachnospiraceae bacterium]|nr:hypothetical protein [Lachnospiraceae bacterium]
MRVQHIFTNRVLRFSPGYISPSNRLQEYLKRSEKIVARLQISVPFKTSSTFLMVKAGDADGLVSGAVHTTDDMLRSASGTRHSLQRPFERMQC